MDETRSADHRSRRDRHPTARTLLAGFDRDGVRRSVMVHATMCLATFAEDAKGAIECGDLATAVAASEQAVRFGVEASLTAFDDVYIGPKYLLRRMARHESLAALLEWDEMWGQPGVSCRDDEVIGLVHRRLLLAGHLAGHAMTTAFRRPVTAFPPFVPRDLGPARDPFLVVVRWPGGTGLMTGVDMVRSLSEDAAVLWSLLDGRPVEEAVDEFARTMGRAPFLRLPDMCAAPLTSGGTTASFTRRKGTEEGRVRASCPDRDDSRSTWHIR